LAYDHWMGVLEAARSARVWGLGWLPEDRTSRYLTITVLCSLLAHLLVGIGFLFSGWLSNPVIVNQGELLFVDTTPDKPREAAPPANPPQPPAPEREKPRPASPPAKAQPSSPPAPPARSVAEIPRPAPPAPAPREVAKAAPPQPPLSPQPEEPSYEGRNAQAPSPPQTAKAQADPQPPLAAPSPASEPRVASVPRPSSPPPGMLGQPGGGSGFQGSQGGVVGQPVPLDTPDPNYREYMQKVRQRIHSKWSYPRDARNRDLEGKLVIEFHIGKDGQLLSLELLQSSGEHVLDISALNAVKLADRYPPLPEAMQREVLPIVAIFTYRVRATQSSTFQQLQ
jgi:periplasmic protein TonB